MLWAHSTVLAATMPPNLVFILTDDNGWAGVGYNNPYVHTPTLDALAADGLKLTSHYVYQFCAPSRGSFLTGRLPFRLSAVKKNFIPWHMPDGTHLGYTMLPRKLKAANYTSVHIGKWHQGLYTPEFTPVGRGFDHSFGFLEGGEDHNTSKTFGNWCRALAHPLPTARSVGWPTHIVCARRALNRPWLPFCPGAVAVRSTSQKGRRTPRADRSHTHGARVPGRS